MREVIQPFVATPSRKAIVWRCQAAASFTHHQLLAVADSHHATLGCCARCGRGIVFDAAAVAAGKRAAAGASVVLVCPGCFTFCMARIGPRPATAPFQLAND